MRSVVLLCGAASVCPGDFVLSDSGLVTCGPFELVCCDTKLGMFLWDFPTFKVSEITVGAT